MNRLRALVVALIAVALAMTGVLTAQEGRSPAGTAPRQTQAAQAPARTVPHQTQEKKPPVPAPKTLAVTAEQAVANLEKALKAVSTLQAKFDQLYFSMSVSEPLHEKGDLFLQKPDLMRWNYKSPQEKVFLYKDGVLETYLAEDKQLTRTPVAKEALQSDIFGIFLGTMAFRDAYRVADTDFPTDASMVRQVRLVPKEEGDFSHILLEIDLKTWLPRRAIFLEWAGNKREFDFSQLRTGVRIPAKTFTLKVPPGTEIIDDTDGIKR